MKKILLCLTVLSFLCLCGCAHRDEEALVKAEEFIADTQGDIYKPCARSDGEKFRIGIIDDNPHYPTGTLLYYAVQEMINDGWITLDEELPFEPDKAYVKEIVHYLSDKDTGSFLEFSDNACFYLNTDGEKNCEDKLEKLISENKVDLIICLGTDPGIFAKRVSRGRIPVLVSFCVDPTAAGITHNKDYSEDENLWAHIAFSGYKDQLRLYKDNFDFKNIGMVYFNEAVAGIAKYGVAAKEMGITISSVKIDDNAITAEDKDAYYKKYTDNILKLVNENKIDAFMINSNMATDEEKAEEICNMLHEMNIPVFSQNGYEFLQKGSPFMSVTIHPKDYAEFLVKTMSGVLNGKKPTEMPQKYNTPLHVSINKGAADKLNISLDYDILKYADKIYY